MNAATDRVPVALVGLGATGIAVARSLQARGEAVRIVAAVDADPAKAGVGLAAITGVDSINVPVRASVAEADLEPPLVAVVTTTSRVEEAQPLIRRLLDSRVNVVSLCEELSFPWRSHPAVAADLDARARAAGVSLLGTGANPGFVMDLLPLVASAALLVVESVVVERAADLSGFGPLLAKFGFGLTPSEFERRLGTDVVGHIGFQQTLAHLCDCLNLVGPGIEVGPPRPILIAGEERSGEHVQVPPGTVAVVEQQGTATSGTVELALREQFGILRPGDPIEPRDRVCVEGNGQSVELVSPHGLDSKRTTVAVLINVLDAVSDAAPGLISMSDLSARSLAAPALAA